MEISLAFDRPEEGPGSGRLTVGWLLAQNKGAVLVNRAGTASPIRSGKLGEVLTLVNEAEWRFPDRPTFQLQLPCYFIFLQMVWMSQIAAFAHYRPEPFTGTIFGGRFPILVWPRPLMWAFEWHKPQKGAYPEARRIPVSCAVRSHGPSTRRAGGGGRRAMRPNSFWCSEREGSVPFSSPEGLRALGTSRGVFGKRASANQFKSKGWPGAELY